MTYAPSRTVPEPLEHEAVVSFTTKFPCKTLSFPLLSLLSMDHHGTPGCISAPPCMNAVMHGATASRSNLSVAILDNTFVGFTSMSNTKSIFLDRFVAVGGFAALPSTMAETQTFGLSAVRTIFDATYSGMS